MKRVALVLILSAACTPAPSLEHRGTFVPAEDWPERSLRPRSSQRGLSARSGEVAILEGDDTLISGVGDAIGLRVDAERNDAAAVTARYVEEIADVPGLLVLFTTFDDRGAGGAAYFLPIFNDTRGTGMPEIDQRAAYGTRNFEGFVNLKNLKRHRDGELLPLIMHELAHRHAAYATAKTGTTTIELRGRQLAHWHAALDSEGSLLEGYDWVKNAPGRFITIGRNQRFSSLDLYLLGLAEPDEVAPFFFIAGARTASGAAIPSEAQLPIGATVFGDELELGIDDVIAAEGERDPPPLADTETHVVFALLTAPDRAATSTTAQADAEAIDRLRGEVAAEWSRLTHGRGSLCTTIAPCTRPLEDGGASTPPLKDEPESCGCNHSRQKSPIFSLFFLLFSGTIRRRCCPSSASK